MSRKDPSSSRSSCPVKSDAVAHEVEAHPAKRVCLHLLTPNLFPLNDVWARNVGGPLDQVFIPALLTVVDLPELRDHRRRVPRLIWELPLIRLDQLDIGADAHGIGRGRDQDGLIEATQERPGLGFHNPIGGQLLAMLKVFDGISRFRAVEPGDLALVDAGILELCLQVSHSRPLGAQAEHFRADAGSPELLHVPLGFECFFHVVPSAGGTVTKGARELCLPQALNSARMLTDRNGGGASPQVAVKGAVLRIRVRVWRCPTPVPAVGGAASPRGWPPGPRGLLSPDRPPAASTRAGRPGRRGGASAGPSGHRRSGGRSSPRRSRAPRG